MRSRYFLVYFGLLAAVILRETSGAPLDPDPTGKSQPHEGPSADPGLVDSGKTTKAPLVGGGDGDNLDQQGGKADTNLTTNTGSGDDNTGDKLPGTNGNKDPDPGIVNPDINTAQTEKTVKGEVGGNPDEKADKDTDPNKNPKDTLNLPNDGKSSQKTVQQPTDKQPTSGDKLTPTKQNEVVNTVEVKRTTIKDTGKAPVPTKETTKDKGDGADPVTTGKTPVSNANADNDTNKVDETGKDRPTVKSTVKPTQRNPNPETVTKTPPKAKDEDKKTEAPVPKTPEPTKKPEKAQMTEKPKETKAQTTLKKTTTKKTTTKKTTTTSTSTSTQTTTPVSDFEMVPTEPQKNEWETEKPAVTKKPAGKKAKKPAEKEHQSQPVVSEDYVDEFETSSSGHFMAYFLTATVLCVAGYVIFHNKQKIIAFIIEGRSTTSGRRPSTKSYQKLKTKVDDVMPSLEKSTTSSNYVY